MDVFPALLEADIPFYSHEIDAYWNDIGNLDELKQGNVDALHGAVAVDPGVPEVADRVWAAGPVDGVALEPPVLVGAGVEIGEGARLVGPAVVGDGCTIGPGAYLYDAILLGGASVPPGSMLAGGIMGPVETRS
jgi:NDP-sugar pyrophosphorylase family protein